MNLNKLYSIIEIRKKSGEKKSYIASLFKKGRIAILQKVGEEAVEVIIDSKKNNRKRMVSEIADLIFHLMVLMVYFEIKPQSIFNELERRNKK